jgi:hypothetical protein
MIKDRRLEDKIKVAWISGDDVLPIIKSKLASVEGIEHSGATGRNEKKSRWESIKNLKMNSGTGLTVRDTWLESGDVSQEVRYYISQQKEQENDNNDFPNLCTGEKLQDWPFKDAIIGAQAYLGGLGIAKAFEEGADIVICGRVSDASFVIGAAVWWHGWHRDDLEELANAFVAGHLIECSNYVCGGNFTGFKAFEGQSWLDIGYPIAEIGKKGEVVITKQMGTGGMVTTETCKAQLLYEIQGPWYFNSDVTAVLDGIKFEQLCTDRVSVQGVKALPPPPTTKIGITARGGYQAEAHWFLVGLDIQEKARMLEAQIRKALGDKSRFHVLKFTLSGTAPEDPSDQNSATVDFRVFAQSRDVNAVAPSNFLRPIIDMIMCSYPGATFHLDFRQGIPKPVQEYYVTLLPQSDIQHVVHIDGETIEVERPSVTKTFPRHQLSQAESLDVRSREWGETVKGPLGWIVHARSGDKGSNANVGFWVRHEDEFEWMRQLLSTENLKILLAKEYSGNKIVCIFSIFDEEVLTVWRLRLTEGHRIDSNCRIFGLSIFFFMIIWIGVPRARVHMISLPRMSLSF